MDSELIKTLLSLREAGEDAALATVIRVTGSTPRNAGAKMLVLKDGRVYGTIGGGCGEAEVKREALDVLNLKVSKKHRLDLTNDVAAGEGMVCGGTMEVFIDFLSCEDNESRLVLLAYLASLQKKEPLLLVTITDIDEGKKQLLGRKMAFLPADNEAGELGALEITEQARILAGQFRTAREPVLITLTAEATQNKIEKLELLFEQGIVTPQILILGGGHIAGPLVKMAAILGYNTTVVDDRPSFANMARFPEAGQVICTGFEYYLKTLETGDDTFIVIITRGHTHDLGCLREVINKPVAYIGMIGSRRKIMGVMTQLESEGISIERLKEVFAPIGLDIGAETPEEIALSILAEIVNVWREGKLIKNKFFKVKN
ncbi:MAG: putative xanthine dehydrogenase subunit A [Pelotomaculum sp. PtaU1.Bin065]|nr:MAG: putative xanthine dehydrogenase subunit A [Pelotomaculum sp. PtaU1.Bin065]